MVFLLLTTWYTVPIQLITFFDILTIGVTDIVSVKTVVIYSQGQPECLKPRKVHTTTGTDHSMKEHKKD